MIDPEFCAAARKKKSILFADMRVSLTGGCPPTVSSLFGVSDDDDPTNYTPLELFLASPKDYPKPYARLLMACELDQVVYLALIYPKFALDEEMIAAYVVLIRRGMFLDLLKKDDTAKNAIMLVHAGIMMGLGK